MEQDWGCSPMVECMLKMYKALDSIHSTEKGLKIRAEYGCVCLQSQHLGS
jgi:hypothetical protein